MTIAITGTKHAKDGLYAQVKVSGDAAGNLLVAHAATTSGSELPVRVLRGDNEGEWLLALSTVSVTQQVSLAVIDWDGATLEELTQKFNPIASRLPSPVGALRRRNAASALHVPQSRDALGEWNVFVDRLITAGDGQNICQGSASICSAGRQSVEGALCIRALDAKGRDASDGTWTCLSDTIEQLTEHPGFFERRVEFSLRISDETNILVLWVRPDEESELPTGFTCLGPRLMARIRELWRTETLGAEADEGYDDWFVSQHQVLPSELSMQQDGSFERGVTFSVVTVLRDASPDALQQTVDSVLEQSYGHLELVLVNSAPDNAQLSTALRAVEPSDARVQLVPLGADFGIAAATSAGIDAATGDYVCLLAEGDLLAPDALWCLASAIDANPGADLLYTDEDRIEHGVHVKPRFKPDWDPDLLLGTNYLGNLMAVRASLLQQMGTMDRELDGAQAYHVALFASTHAQGVCHVPRVLYHACAPVEPREAGATGMAAGLVALRRHVEATGVKANVRPSTRVQQCYEVIYDLPDEPPLVSVLIVNRDNVTALDRCLTSLREHTDYARYEVVVVEHESADPDTFAYYRDAEATDERVRTIFYQGEGASNYACLVNFGASRAEGDVLVLLSPDVEITDAGWMARLASLCVREDTGAAGARLVRPDGTIAFTGGFLSTHGPVALDRYRLGSDCPQPDSSLLHEVTLASGSCLAVDVAAWRRLGGLSLAYPRRYGDADFCLRLVRAGYRVVLDPQVTVVTHRPLTEDERPWRDAEDLCAMGCLWQSWPFGSSPTDPSIGPNVSHLSAYRILRSQS